MFRSVATRGLRITSASSPCLYCTQRISCQETWRRGQSTTTTPTTHYSFFPKAIPHGPPPKAPFPIDLSALKREFLQLQARAHPDMHAQLDKKRAEALSARINEAYKTLQNPLLRAQYLLSLRGIEVAADETAKVEDGELLLEVLEVREQIEEAGREEDLEEIRRANEERIRESEVVLEKAFKEDDVESATRETVRLRYWTNIKESVDNWERSESADI
ncbi:Co-chaperone HscB, C-terminal oligomerization domain-containing protein [Phaeosphaeriaceae sp. PMI808]|nr:Co-chaperone HscB, C-terminal oligomerization domain-containing protein [Phaeosphaeriaceae sp. PMI808]